MSTDGGSYPRWRRDGRELYFYFDTCLIAAAIRVTGSSLEPGVPQTLFRLSDPFGASSHAPYHPFAVTADGQRFLIAQPRTGAAVERGGRGGGDIAQALADLADQGGAAGRPTANQVTVVLNWQEELKQHVPTR